jgi:hypothetical protein
VTTDELVVVDGGATKKITAANLAKVMPGYELGYVQSTSNQTTTQTVEASATTIFTMASITFDGSTACRFEVYSPFVFNSTSAGLRLNLWEDSTNLGYLTLANSASGSTQLPLYVVYYKTPSAGAKVYTVRMYVTSSSTATFGAGAGSGAGVYMPSFFRITRA